MDASPKIGVDMVYVAPLTDGTDVEGGTPVWGTPVRLSGAASVKANPNGSIVTDYADNGPFFIANARGNLQLALDMVDVDPDVRAAILGQTRANGITQEGTLDQAPYYAVGFRVWYGGKDGGANVYEYFWYMKGKFTVPEDGADTKKETVAPQHVMLNCEFAKLRANDAIVVRARTNAAGIVATTITNWFNSVVYKTTQSLTAVTVGTVVGDASDNTLTIPFAKSGETFQMVAPSAGDITVSVVSTGLPIAGTSTYAVSVAGVAPTITITNANIAEVEYLITITNRVKDANGVAVALTSQLVTPAA
jgi:phi13 family phage major tail protein